MTALLEVSLNLEEDAPMTNPSDKSQAQPMTDHRGSASTDAPVSIEAPVSFEKAFEQLQSVVKKLESGELSLEQSLKQFEEGVRLSRVCQEFLGVAEQRVELLIKDGSAAGNPGQYTTQPFGSTKSN